MSNKTTMTSKTTVTTESRQQQLQQWLQQVFDGQRFTLDSLPGDASSRRYHRLQLSDHASASSEDFTQNSAPRYIVMDSADEQEAMQQFIAVADLMAPAINVPKLIAQDLSQGFLVLQDFGSVEFAHLLVEATSKQVDEYYQWAMQTLLALQQVSIDNAQVQEQLPHYDEALLNREMDLFYDWFLPLIGATVDKGVWEALKKALITAILAQPQVIVHRDYHSRNLMQDQADVSRLGVIDFQDAVIGAYSYDLVSLVRDAYVDWTETQVSKWIHDFWQLQQHAGIDGADSNNSAEQFEHDVNVMGVQRHLKVLGIFIRLSQRDGKDRYLADIPKVMRDLLFELQWLGERGQPKLKEAIAPFNHWLQEQVLSAYKHKFNAP